MTAEVGCQRKVAKVSIGIFPFINRFNASTVKIVTNVTLQYVLYNYSTVLIKKTTTKI